MKIKLKNKKLALYHSFSRYNNYYSYKDNYLSICLGYNGDNNNCNNLEVFSFKLGLYMSIRNIKNYDY